MYTNSSFRRVASDILDLCELQLQLLSIDSQEARRKITTAVSFAAVAVTLAGSALTTMMVAAGYLLHELSGWSIGASLLTISISTFAVVTVLLVIAAVAIKRASAAMSETKSEFAENLKWIKAVLISPGDSPRNQLRAESFPESSNQQIPPEHRPSQQPTCNPR